MRAASFILVVLFAMVSCSRDTGPAVSVAADTANKPIEAGSSSTLPPDTGEPALHAVQSDRLQQAMKQLNAIAYTQMISEVDLSTESRLRTDTIAKIAH